MEKPTSLPPTESFNFEKLFLEKKKGEHLWSNTNVLVRLVKNGDFVVRYKNWIFTLKPQPIETKLLIQWKGYELFWSSDRAIVNPLSWLSALALLKIWYPEMIPSAFYGEDKNQFHFLREQ